MEALLRFMTIGALVLLVSSLTGLYVSEVWMEDARPMSLHFQSSLDHVAMYRISPSLRPTDAVAGGDIRLPVIWVGERSLSETVSVLPQQSIDIPIGLDAPTGILDAILGRIATGDFVGVVQIEALDDVPPTKPVVFRVSFHVKTLWETYRLMLGVILISVFAFTILYLICRQCLTLPTGSLRLMKRDDLSDELVHIETWDLGRKQFHFRKLFWMRDLIRVNSLLPSLRIGLPTGERIAPFQMQFGKHGFVMLSCIKGELPMRTDSSDEIVFIAAPEAMKQWRQRLGNAKDQTESETELPLVDSSEEVQESGPLLFASDGIDESSGTSTSGRDDGILRSDSRHIDSDQAIILGRHLIIYDTTIGWDES